MKTCDDRNRFLAAPAGPAGVGNPARARTAGIRLALAAATLWLAAGAELPAKPKWDPIDPADLAARDSTASPGADAEVLLSRHAVDTAGSSLITRHYIRAKLYTTKGVEDQGKLDIEGQFESSIERVAARVVKPDGTSVDLAKGDIHESTVAKVGGLKVSRTSFAFPNLAPGDLVEYQWEERRDLWEAYYRYTWVFAQGKVPVREFRFAVENYPLAFQVLWFHAQHAEVKRVQGVDALLMHNLPAFQEEGDMPPERDFRAWVMVTPNDYGSKETSLWQEVSENRYDAYDDLTRPTGPVKQMAAKLTAGAGINEDKLRRIHEFCVREIVNLDQTDAADQQAAEQKREKSREYQSPKETLAKRSGSGLDIDLLFAALARAAGNEVRTAWNASRTDLYNVRDPKGWYFLTNLIVAVKGADGWTYHDPARYFVPFGTLRWWDEGVTAFIPDPKKVVFEMTPISRADASAARRKARFTLDAEGTLEGTVEEAMTGHLAINIKSSDWTKSQDDIDRETREGITSRLPTAEVSEIKWTNLRTFEFPVTLTYHVRVPGYAETAGKRLIVTPGYFEMGRPARFTAEKREFPIFFSYASSEHDDIEIVFPAGLEIEAGSAPADVGDREHAIGTSYTLGVRPRQRTILYKRDFALGAEGNILFRTESYPVLKRLFEAIRESDSHSVILHPSPFATPEPPAGGAADAATAAPAESASKE